MSSGARSNERRPDGSPGFSSDPSSAGAAYQSDAPRRPSATVTAGEATSYYGRPVIKEPVWSWEIPAYFFIGGIAGASASLGVGAQLTGNEALARSAWSTSLAGVVISPVLLISDLGRPMRFLNMMRMFKVTSPMSVGSWILSGTGATVALAAGRHLIGWPRRAGELAGGLAGTIFGPGLVTYTGVLLADTAVPVWHEARRFLPVSFAASAMGAAGGATSIVTPVAEAGPARRLAIIGGLLEGVATQAMERHLGELGRPYREGKAGRYSRAAKVLSVAGAALMRWGGHRRSAAVAGGAALMGGSFCLRFAVYHAGFQSARDPEATVRPQRARAAIRNGG